MSQSSRVITAAAILMLLAGLTHLAAAPVHWSHAPAHAIFFIAAGIAQIVWAALFWRRPSARLYDLGIVLAASLIALWVITRWLPAPFHGVPEPVDAFGVLSKLCEALCIAALILWAAAQARLAPVGQRIWRRAALLLAVALISGFAIYEVARAAQPLLPGLTASEEGHTHEHEEEGHTHEHPDEPSEGHEH